MKNFSIPMGIIDFIPVIFFTIAAIILQRELYNKMSKGAFALFAVGTIDIICAGIAKALYKLLYAAGICDFKVLSDIFFPVQSIGFLLAGIGILAMLIHRQGKNAALCVVPPVFTGTAIFVSCMCIGLAMIYIALCIISVKLKRPLLIIVFVLSFLCSLTMGYLSSKDFAQSYMNWLAQVINIAGQGLFFYGVIAMHKAGLADLVLGK
ncbi:hypothetical protein [Butyrivibrio sp. INlla14]|uniref:hypothetical protein n=1 Tax=Butyrivibrio sp. INlla14 TaxID=1520808 RepID=UPI0008760A5D|nr:hypothetical protein [Butyrivibrio sp. INlla14]SCY09669.1 hypothetical protein SAMN02910371_01031 [Butyrivibrio sp. INlla14]